MSVWPKPSPGLSLTGREGTLALVSIDTEPTHLELLLEALAQVSFPLNPEIYHNAAVVYIYSDGHEKTEPVTLVEFPAYAGQLEEVRGSIAAYGFAPASLAITPMLDALHSERVIEPAPAGADYVGRYRLKSHTAAAVH
jgi:hypothetical protein